MVAWQCLFGRYAGNQRTSLDGNPFGLCRDCCSLTWRELDVIGPSSNLFLGWSSASSHTSRIFSPSKSPRRNLGKLAFTTYCDLSTKPTLRLYPFDPTIYTSTETRNTESRTIRPCAMGQFEQCHPSLTYWKHHAVLSGRMCGSCILHCGWPQASWISSGASRRYPEFERRQDHADFATDNTNHGLRFRIVRRCYRGLLRFVFNSSFYEPSALSRLLRYYLAVDCVSICLTERIALGVGVYCWSLVHRLWISVNLVGFSTQRSK